VGATASQPPDGTTPAPRARPRLVDRLSALRVRHWRLRTKLAAVLVVPSIAFLTLAGIQVNGLVGQASNLSDFAAQVGIGREITELVHHLQQERDRTAGELAALKRGGQRADRAATAAAMRPLQAGTDGAMRDFTAAADPLADADASWRIGYGQVLEAYEQLLQTRAEVPPAFRDRDSILAGYDRTIDALLTLLAEPSPGPQRPELNDAVLRYVQFARYKEASSRIRAVLYDAARAGRYALDDPAHLTDLRAGQLAALAAFRGSATPEQIALQDRAAQETGFVVAADLEGRTLVTGVAAPQVLGAEEWWQADRQRHDVLHRVQLSVLDDAVQQAEAVESAQLRRTVLAAGAVLLVLLAALLTSMAIGRSIARSMRTLRSAAMKVAQVELPETLQRLRSVRGEIPEITVTPPAVRSRDEVGELAEAFVAVHRSAVGVAVEQATMRRNVNAMFVNLARRSQVLVERQLELLDGLEREESDPQQLENLFRLDHLAARMRRNDESLLVLAGTESSRRWNRPTALSTVVLAATAEIEQYHRVQRQHIAEVQVVGHAVGELVHLLAELLENATAFSRPDTPVQVMARVESDGGALVEIVDQGIGMGEASLAELNALLSAPAEVDVAASERMGLFVVSNLAARHGIRVQLRPGPEGLIAAVRVPSRLLTGAQPQQLESPALRRVGGLWATGSADRGTAMPVAGRRPVAALTPRPVPTRAEDVLVPESEPSTWWSARAATGNAAPAQRTAPPAVPVTGGTNERGLPVRVPMAQLSEKRDAPARPAARHDPDPDAVGGTLSRFYQGVRRAESEETVEITLPSAADRSEGK